MNFPAYQTLALEQRDEHILLVTLNRPQVLNALNTQMGKDQHDLWTRLTAEPGALRCVVLTGAGDRAFCAGADLKERDGMTETVWRAQHEIFERAFMALMELPLPVIAAVNGHAFGGGLEMAPLAVRQAKKSMHYGLQMDLLTGYRFEIEAYNQLVGTEDRKEGVRAFNEKRKPRFQGK